jgi:hypothetical protein
MISKGVAHTASKISNKVAPWLSKLTCPVLKARGGQVNVGSGVNGVILGLIKVSK